MTRRLEEDKRLYARAYEAGKKFAGKDAKKLLTLEEFAIVQRAIEHCGSYYLFNRDTVVLPIRAIDRKFIEAILNKIRPPEKKSEGTWSLGISVEERGQVFHICQNQDKKFKAGKENFHGQSDFICPNCLAKKEVR